MAEELGSLNELSRTYGGWQIGRPPSPCFDECDVMHNQVTAEHRGDIQADHMSGYRLAVHTILSRALNDSEGFATFMDEVKADKSKYLGFAELEDDEIAKSLKCAAQIAQGNCRLLDIVVRKVGGVAAYTTTDTTKELFKAAEPVPDEDPVDYYSIDNTTVVIREDGSVGTEMIEKPRAMTAEEAWQHAMSTINNRARGRGRH